MLIPCSWLPLPPCKTLLGAGSSAGRAGVTVTLPLLPPAPQRNAQGHQEAPQKGCTPRRTLGEVLGPRAVSLEQWHSSRSTGLGGRLHSTHRAPRHHSEHRVPKGQAQGCAHCLPSPTALHNAPPPTSPGPAISSLVIYGGRRDADTPWGLPRVPGTGGRGLNRSAAESF